MMTREEAIKVLNNFPIDFRNSGGFEAMEDLKIAILALRPISREQVEKSWVGCEYCEKHKSNLVRIEMNYNDSPGSPKRLNPTRVPKFCPMCGRPLTDEAVDITLKRLESLHGKENS